MTRRLRIASYLGVVLVLVAMLGPPALWSGRDSYPLSTYPMFSSARPATSSVATVVGATAEGEKVRLTPYLLAGTDEVMLAVTTVSRAVGRGDAATASLCRQVADRVGFARRNELVAIEVVTETYHAVDHLTDGAPPMSTTVHAVCRVG